MDTRTGNITSFKDVPDSEREFYVQLTKKEAKTLLELPSEEREAALKELRASQGADEKRKLQENLDLAAKELGYTPDGYQPSGPSVAFTGNFTHKKITGERRKNRRKMQKASRRRNRK